MKKNLFIKMWILFTCCVCILLATSSEVNAEKWYKFSAPPPIGAFYADFDSIAVEQYAPPKYILSVRTQVPMADNRIPLKFRYDYDQILIECYITKYNVQYGQLSGWETLYPNMNNLNSTLYYKLGVAIWEHVYKIPFGNPKTKIKKLMNDAEVRLNYGNYEGAIECYQEALKLNPKNANAFFGMGFRQKNLKDEVKAIESFHKALEINPNFAECYNQSGIIACEAGLYDKALEAFTQAIKLDSKNTLYHSNMGIAYHMLGKYEDALACYDKALEIDKNNKNAKTARKEVTKILKKKK